MLFRSGVDYFDLYKARPIALPFGRMSETSTLISPLAITLHHLLATHFARKGNRGVGGKRDSSCHPWQRIILPVCKEAQPASSRSGVRNETSAPKECDDR